MKVGDLVRWLDPWKVKRIGLIAAVLNCAQDGYYDVLVEGKIEFCHRTNLEVLSEGRWE